MKIGVLADTHDNVPRIRQAVELFNQEGVARVIHAGDFVAPFSLEPLQELNCEVLGVFGNNDGEREGLAARFREIGEVHPFLATTTLEGRRIAAVHYRELAEPLAGSGAFDLVVFGHTHEIEQRQEGALLLNPGEAGLAHRSGHSGDCGPERPRGEPPGALARIAHRSWSRSGGNARGSKASRGRAPEAYLKYVEDVRPSATQETRADPLLQQRACEQCGPG